METLFSSKQKYLDLLHALLPLGGEQTSQTPPKKVLTLAFTLPP